MLDGWRAQQLARNLALATAGRREAMVRAFAAHADAFPWQWGPGMLDEWLGELRGVKGLRRSTVRAYASSVSAADTALSPVWQDSCLRPCLRLSGSRAPRSGRTRSGCRWRDRRSRP